MDMGRDSYCNEHHIKIMKVALAIAIIRQKPESVSSLDYTLDLAQCFRGEELNWRGRVRGLERELLRTRQELVQCRLQETALTSQCPQAACCYEEEMGMDGGRGAWQSSGYSSAGFPNGSVGGVKGDCVGVVMDMSGEDGEAMEGGLVVSKLREKSESIIGDSEWLEAHVKFCTSVSRVQRVHNKLPSVLVTDIQETFKDTILDAIRGLKESLASGNPPYPQKVLSAVPCLTDFLSNPGLSLHDRTELSEAVVSLADALISKKNESYSEQWLQSAVLVLCKVQVVLTHVLHTLVSQLRVSAELFLGSLEGGALPSADQIDSAHGQVAMLEALLKKYNVSKNIESEVRYKMASDLELEGSLLEVSWSYPLFVYAVWRVIAMLTK